MSRAGYSDDCESGWELIMWRGAVNSAIKGKRGQAFLKDLAAAMDAMPDKRLIAEELEHDGQYCTLGVIGHARGIDLSKIDTEDWSTLSNVFGIAESMAREIMYINDESGLYPKGDEDGPSKRWRQVRAWIESEIKPKGTP